MALSLSIIVSTCLTSVCSAVSTYLPDFSDYQVHILCTFLSVCMTVSTFLAVFFFFLMFCAHFFLSQALSVGLTRFVYFCVCVPRSFMFYTFLSLSVCLALSASTLQVLSRARRIQHKAVRSSDSWPFNRLRTHPHCRRRYLAHFRADNEFYRWNFPLSSVK